MVYKKCSVKLLKGQLITKQLRITIAYKCLNAFFFSFYLKAPLEQQMCAGESALIVQVNWSEFIGNFFSILTETYNYI